MKSVFFWKGLGTICLSWWWRFNDWFWEARVLVTDRLTDICECRVASVAEKMSNFSLSWHCFQMITPPKTPNTTEPCTTTLTTMEQLIFLCWQRMEMPSQPPAPLISSKWTLANSSGTIITVANDGFWLFSMNIAFSQHSHNNWGFIYHIPLGQVYQSFSSHQKVKKRI